MNHKKIFTVFLLFSAAIFFMALHPLVSAASNPDWDKGKCMLTVESGNVDKIESADITVDLYKVAWMEKDEKRGYRFVAADILKNTRIDGITANEFLSWINFDTGIQAAEWETVAQAMAKAVFGVEESWDLTSAKISPTASQKMSNGKAVFQNLDFALYLVVARDTGMTARNYVTADEDGQLVTISGNEKYTYSFLPVLLSLPGNDGNAWSYNAETVLKASKENTPTVTEKSYGVLRIKKILSKYAGGKIDFQFLAEIYRKAEDYKSGNKPFQSFPVSVSFSDKGEKIIQVSKKIPADSYIVVKEIKPVKPYYLEKSQWRKTKTDGTYYDHKTTDDKNQDTVVAGNIGKGETILITFTNSYKKDKSTIINHPINPKPDKDQHKIPVKTGESEFLWIFIASLIFLIIGGIFLIIKNISRKKSI